MICILARNKAPGYDCITEELLVRTLTIIFGPLTRMFSRMLFAGYFPACWKRGELKLLFKGGDKDPTVSSSYRPLTLLPVVGTVFEKVLHLRINSMFTSNQQLMDDQYRFRPCKGTEDAILRVLYGGCRIVAYADDGLLLVKGNSWLEIESRATKACKFLRLRSLQHKMVFSAEKITMMFLKCHLAASRDGRPSD